jgi:Tfp pilus assembly protein PilF
MVDSAAVKMETKMSGAWLDRRLLFKGITIVAAMLIPLVLLVMVRAKAERAPAPTSKLTFDQYIAQARQFLDSQKPQESLAPLERALELRPKSFAVHNNQCVAFGLLARKDEAIAACRQAIAIEPTNRLARNNLRWVQSIGVGAAP